VTSELTKGVERKRKGKKNKSKDAGNEREKKKRNLGENSSNKCNRTADSKPRVSQGADLWKGEEQDLLTVRWEKGWRKDLVMPDGG